MLSIKYYKFELCYYNACIESIIFPCQLMKENTWSRVTTATGTQRGRGISILGDIQNRKALGARRPADVPAQVCD